MSGTARSGVVDDQIAEGAVFEAGRVRHDVPERDRLVEGDWNLHRFEVFVDVGMEIEPPLFDQLHDRHPGGQLGYRADAEKRRLWVDRGLRLDVLVAVTLGEDDFAAAGNRDRPRRAVVVLHQRFDHAIEECFELGAVFEARERFGRPGSCRSAFASSRLHGGY